jgi:prophage tail gpP-like protein
MPADRDTVEVVIGGKTQAAWSRYEIDSDLMTPADAWSVSLQAADLALPAEVRTATTAQIRVGGDLVMTGQIDSRSHAIRKGQQSLELRGRDGAAVLLDCSAPVFAAKEITLQEVITKVARPLGVSKVRIEADDSLVRERVAIEPGESGWQAIQRAAEANGLWPWFEPDGTLVVGGPDYSTPPVDHLVLRRDGVGNNIQEVTEQADPAERFSDVTVLGQVSSTSARTAGASVRSLIKDTGVVGYRPKVVVDHEAVNAQVAGARARKIISDAHVKAWGLSVLVKGHRTASGLLWRPGQRVQVQVEDLGINTTLFVIARRFTGLPALTLLTLREDGAWVLAAHPKSLRRKSPKAGPGKIIDLVGGTP